MAGYPRRDVVDVWDSRRYEDEPKRRAPHFHARDYNFECTSSTLAQHVNLGLR